MIWVFFGFSSLSVQQTGIGLGQAAKEKAATTHRPWEKEARARYRAPTCFW